MNQSKMPQNLRELKIEKGKEKLNVKPIRIFRVNFHDLPENIELEDFPEHK